MIAQEAMSFMPLVKPVLRSSTDPQQNQAFSAFVAETRRRLLLDFEVADEMCDHLQDSLYSLAWAYQRLTENDFQANGSQVLAAMDVFATILVVGPASWPSSRCLVEVPDSAMGLKVPMSAHIKSCFKKLARILLILDDCQENFQGLQWRAWQERPSWWLNMSFKVEVSDIDLGLVTGYLHY